MIEIEDFLQHVVEGYLQYDMGALAVSGVGYPWLMTSFAAIELFGALRSTSRFDYRRGAHYFVGFWANAVYPSRTKRAPQGRALYKLARHGIAHAFMPKGPILVAGGNSWRHLTVDSGGILFLDPEQLAADVMAAYFAHVKSALSATAPPTRDSMNTRLHEMLGDAEADAGALNLAGIFPARPASPAPTPSSTPVTSTGVSMAYRG